jgi:hypothetical protein
MCPVYQEDGPENNLIFFFLTGVNYDHPFEHEGAKTISRHAKINVKKQQREDQLEHQLSVSNVAERAEVKNEAMKSNNFIGSLIFLWLIELEEESSHTNKIR